MKSHLMRHYLFCLLLCGGAAAAGGQSKPVSPGAESGLESTPVKINRTVPNVSA